MLRFVGKVLHREEDADVLVEVVARLRIELPIGRCIDLVHLRDAVLIGNAKVEPTGESLMALLRQEYELRIEKP